MADLHLSLPLAVVFRACQFQIQIKFRVIFKELDLYLSRLSFNINFLIG